MSGDVDSAGDQTPAEEDKQSEPKPMNRAERRAAGKKGAGQQTHGGAQRGPSSMGGNRGGFAPHTMNQTRGSNRGK